MATHSRILAWKTYRQRSLVGYSVWGGKESETTALVHTQTHRDTHTDTDTHTQTHTHTDTQTQTHTQTHTHTHTSLGIFHYFS